MGVVRLIRKKLRAGVRIGEGIRALPKDAVIVREYEQFLCENLCEKPDTSSPRGYRRFPLPGATDGHGSRMR
jgi:hypothetical protein